MKIASNNKMKNARRVNIPINRDVNFPRNIYLKHKGKNENFKSSLFFIKEAPPEIPRYIRPPTGIPKLVLYFVYVPLSECGLYNQT